MIQTEIIGFQTSSFTKFFPELVQTACTSKYTLETQKLKINKFLLDQKTNLIIKNLKGLVLILWPKKYLFINQ